MNIPALRTGEDIIYDEDAILTEQEKVEKVDKTDSNTIGDQENVNTKVHELNTTPCQEIATGAEVTEFETLDKMIEQLPESFPEAVELIKNNVVPMIADCDAGLRDHYITVVKKKTNAASKIAVKQIVEDAIKQMNSVLDTEVEEAAEEPVDPEIIELADHIAKDPLLFKNRIDIVGKLGVIGERKNIGLIFLVMDSRLLPMDQGVSESLAGKISGDFGAGKSFTQSKCIELYPISEYHLITSGSDKSLYNIIGGLKHKVLILAEAQALESSGGRDNELAYAIRSLVSEGRLAYQYTSWKDKEKVTIVKKMEGPTALLTTTIKGKLEEQLEDRLITMHPNTSNEQTHNIIERTAELAAGEIETVDKKTISAWKLFNQSLVPVEVVIPFAPDISHYVNRNELPPISARRAFKRVVSAVKTIALMYQKQRCKDDLGRVIAEISDYAIAVQLIEDSFRESFGKDKRYTDNRIKIIEKYGKIMSKDLAKLSGVKGAAISQWSKPLVDRGILTWCDENADEFPDVESLEKAKRSGKAFIKVGQFNRLPTPFELTGNPDWDIDGKLYQQYDFGFESTDTGVSKLREGEQSSSPLNPSDDSHDLENKEKTGDSMVGDKVLSFKSHKEVMKMVAERKENQEEFDPNDPEFIKFQNELAEILKPDNVSAID